jgi:hypothetical protein
MYVAALAGVCAMAVEQANTMDNTIPTNLIPHLSWFFAYVIDQGR